MLVGPSGCGKTTTMKMINRLIEPTTGRILLGDDDVTRVDPVELRRRIGYVIQNVGLFPHQTVAPERRHRAAAARLGQEAHRGPGRGAAATWSGSTRRPTATATRTSSPAASASAPASPARWPPTPPSC